MGIDGKANGAQSDFKGGSTRMTFTFNHEATSKGIGFLEMNGLAQWHQIFVGTIDKDGRVPIYEDYEKAPIKTFKLAEFNNMVNAALKNGAQMYITEFSKDNIWANIDINLAIMKDAPSDMARVEENNWFNDALYDQYDGYLYDQYGDYGDYDQMNLAEMLWMYGYEQGLNAAAAKRKTKSVRGKKKSKKKALLRKKYRY